MKKIPKRSYNRACTPVENASKIRILIKVCLKGAKPCSIAEWAKNIIFNLAVNCLEEFVFENGFSGTVEEALNEGKRMCNKCLFYNPEDEVLVR